MLEQLKKTVFDANIALVKNNLVILTWGNVSGIDRDSGLVAIKPSGIEYDKMTADEIVIVDLDGKIVDGKLKPSSDLPTHLELYKNFSDCNGIVHTHSSWATIFAQSQREIPLLGTTHADYFLTDIPLTRLMTDGEIKNDYEKNTGKVIVECFKDKNPSDCSAVLVASHGPFTWGKSPEKAVENAVVLENIAFMAYHSMNLNNNMQKTLINKHFYRKHGKNAYYGQK